MQDRPTSIELLNAAADFVEREIVPVTQGQRQFQSRVVANVMRIVAREIEIGEPLLRAEVDALATLLNEKKPHLHTTSDVLDAARKFNEQLSARIRAGEADHGDFRDQVFKVTRQIVEDKLKISNPRYLDADLKMRAKNSTSR